MGIRVLWFFSVFLMALTLGLSWCHVVQIPPQLSWSGPFWVTVIQSLYSTFGLAGGLTWIGSILSLWFLVFLVRKRRPVFWWTLAAAVLMIVELPIAWTFIGPVNAVLMGWAPQAPLTDAAAYLNHYEQTLPSDWLSYRTRWETGHAVSAALEALAFGALLVAVVKQLPSHSSRKESA